MGTARSAGHAAQGARTTNIIDPLGRRHTYLRLSLTEACQLTCTYCVPKGSPFRRHFKHFLTFEQIGSLLRGFRAMGFEKVRFTGGEPTLHPRCLDAVALAKDLGFPIIALSSNAVQLAPLQRWVDAGLTSLNISLDSLEPQRFAEMTGSDSLAKVLAVVDEALTLPLKVKINAVLMRSRNGDEIAPLVEWALARPLTLRFIELMPTELNHGFAASERVSNQEIATHLNALGLKEEPIPAGAIARGPEKVFYSPHAPGRIGLISPLSGNFCGSCNRLRVTALGKLRLCLFGDHDYDINLNSAETVMESVGIHIQHKKEGHLLAQDHFGNNRSFRQMGG